MGSPISHGLVAVAKALQQARIDAVLPSPALGIIISAAMMASSTKARAMIREIQGKPPPKSMPGYFHNTEDRSGPVSVPQKATMTSAVPG